VAATKNGKENSQAPVGKERSAVRRSGIKGRGAGGERLARTSMDREASRRLARSEKWREKDKTAGQ